MKAREDAEMGKAWDADRKVGRWDREVISDEELRRINAGIDQTMKSVIADRHYDPIHALDATTREAHDARKVTPAGAAPAKVPGEPSEPWKPMHPVQDWIRLGSTVQAANVESAEKALREAGEEEPGSDAKRGASRRRRWRRKVR
jgi:hypothetical protein